MKRTARKKKQKNPRKHHANRLKPRIPESPLVRALSHYGKQIRRYFVAGVLIWVPLIITLWVSWWVFKNIGLGFEVIIKNAVLAARAAGERYSALRFLGELRYIPGIGFLLVIALFLFTGYVARYLATQKAISYGEQLVRKIPLISHIYVAVQQIRDVFISRNGAIFEEVAVVEYPRPGTFALGFITSRARGIVSESIGDAYIAVFVPTTPNPTSGFLLFFPNEQVKVLDMSIEDAMKLIISGGVYVPEQDNAGTDERA